MPGFTIKGETGSQNKDNKIESKRKHRWRFTTGFLNQDEWVYLEKAARPSFNLETPEMHHDQEVAYFAGKQTFEEITLEFYDVFGNGKDLSARLYEWIAGGGDRSVVDLSNISVMSPRTYKTQVTLEMTDGKGTAIETWTLYGAWPKSTNWNDLDYSNTEIQRITTVLRFDRAIKS